MFDLDHKDYNIKDTIVDQRILFTPYETPVYDNYKNVVDYVDNEKHTFIELLGDVTKKTVDEKDRLQQGLYVWEVIYKDTYTWVPLVLKNSKETVREIRADLPIQRVYRPLCDHVRKIDRKVGKELKWYLFRYGKYNKKLADELLDNINNSLSLEFQHFKSSNNPEKFSNTMLTLMKIEKVGTKYMGGFTNWGNISEIKDKVGLVITLDLLCQSRFSSPFSVVSAQPSVCINEPGYYFAIQDERFVATILSIMPSFEKKTIKAFDYKMSNFLYPLSSPGKKYSENQEDAFITVFPVMETKNVTIIEWEPLYPTGLFRLDDVPVKAVFIEIDHVLERRTAIVGSPLRIDLQKYVSALGNWEVPIRSQNIPPFLHTLPVYDLQSIQSDSAGFYIFKSDDISYIVQVNVLGTDMRIIREKELGEKFFLFYQQYPKVVQDVFLKNASSIPNDDLFPLQQFDPLYAMSNAWWQDFVSSQVLQRQITLAENFTTTDLLIEILGEKVDKVLEEEEERRPVIVRDMIEYVNKNQYAVEEIVKGSFAVKNEIYPPASTHNRIDAAHVKFISEMLLVMNIKLYPDLHEIGRVLKVKLGHLYSLIQHRLPDVQQFYQYNRVYIDNIINDLLRHPEEMRRQMKNEEGESNFLLTFWQCELTGEEKRQFLEKYPRYNFTFSEQIQERIVERHGDVSLVPSKAASSLSKVTIPPAPPATVGVPTFGASIVLETLANAFSQRAKSIAGHLDAVLDVTRHISVNVKKEVDDGLADIVLIDGIKFNFDKQYSIAQKEIDDELKSPLIVSATKTFAATMKKYNNTLKKQVDAEMDNVKIAQTTFRSYRTPAKAIDERAIIREFRLNEITDERQRIDTDFKSLPSNIQTLSNDELRKMYIDIQPLKQRMDDVFASYNKKHDDILTRYGVDVNDTSNPKTGKMAGQFKMAYDDLVALNQQITTKFDQIKKRYFNVFTKPILDIYELSVGNIANSRVISDTISGPLKQSFSALVEMLFGMGNQFYDRRFFNMLNESANRELFKKLVYNPKLVGSFLNNVLENSLKENNILDPLENNNILKNNDNLLENSLKENNILEPLKENNILKNDTLLGDLLKNDEAFAIISILKHIAYIRGNDIQTTLPSTPLTGKININTTSRKSIIVDFLTLIQADKYIDSRIFDNGDPLLSSPTSGIAGVIRRESWQSTKDALLVITETPRRFYLDEKITKSSVVFPIQAFAFHNGDGLIVYAAPKDVAGDWYFTGKDKWEKSRYNFSDFVHASIYGEKLENGSEKILFDKMVYVLFVKDKTDVNEIDSATGSVLDENLKIAYAVQQQKPYENKVLPYEYDTYYNYIYGVMKEYGIPSTVLDILSENERITILRSLFKNNMNYLPPLSINNQKIWEDLEDRLSTQWGTGSDPGLLVFDAFLKSNNFSLDVHLMGIILTDGTNDTRLVKNRASGLWMKYKNKATTPPRLESSLDVDFYLDNSIYNALNVLRYYVEPLYKSFTTKQSFELAKKITLPTVGWDVVNLTRSVLQDYANNISGEPKSKVKFDLAKTLNDFQINEWFSINNKPVVSSNTRFLITDATFTFVHTVLVINPLTTKNILCVFKSSALVFKDDAGILFLYYRKDIRLSKWRIKAESGAIPSNADPKQLPLLFTGNYLANHNSYFQVYELAYTLTEP